MLCFHVDVDFIVEIWLYNESSLIKYDKYLVTCKQEQWNNQAMFVRAKANYGSGLRAAATCHANYIKAFRLNEYENCD